MRSYRFWQRHWNRREAAGTSDGQDETADTEEGEASYSTYVCLGCGYEYDPAIGDEDAEILPGTLFEKLPEDWVCPECAEKKTGFIEVKP